MIAQNPPKVGRNIQTLRKEKRLTLGLLSDRSGVSKAMLSQIETEKVNPTVATVWKIAQGLQVPVEKLLEDGGEEGRRFHVSRSEHITSLDTDENGVRIKVLSPFSMVEDLEIYQLILAPGAVLDSTSHFPKTEEFLTIISGAVRVRAGENISELHAGDFISYHCDVDHSMRNIGNCEAVVHMVVRFHRPRSRTG
jgi:XRE family transcriptional regulator, regulator of sulfur utilization